MKKMTLEELFDSYLPAGKVLGIVGCGARGEILHHFAEKRHVETLLCDPPRAAEESEEEWSNTCELWGNGMGGKVYAKEEFLTFLPLEYVLKKAQVLCILVPENTLLFTKENMKLVTEEKRILNFSGRGIFAEEALSYCTEVCFPEVSVNFME